MKKQCNLCDLRDDSVDLCTVNRTWCLVFEKEVENKAPGCECWKPDSGTDKNDRIQIANEIKRQYTQSKIHHELVEQKILDRTSSEKTARRAYIISIVSALVALGSCIAAWIAVLKAK